MKKNNQRILVEFNIGDSSEKYLNGVFKELLEDENSVLNIKTPYDNKFNPAIFTYTTID